MPAYRFMPGSVASALNSLVTSRAAGVFLAASLFYRGDDERRLARLQRVADTVRVPLIATNDVLYHDPWTPAAAGRAHLRSREDDDRQGGRKLRPMPSGI